MEHGIHKDKISVYPRGVNITRFHPEKANGFYKKYNAEGGINLLYVGRVSKEKNWNIWPRRLKSSPPSTKTPAWSWWGDGPYREQMQKRLAGKNILFTGYLDGEDLTEAYASSDFFVFPSTTDTFGNVVLEAQASGIPVIVTDQGGPMENMIPEKTGLVVKGKSVDSLVQAMAKMADSPSMLREMKVNAREYMQGRSFEAAFSQAWELYKDHGLKMAG